MKLLSLLISLSVVTVAANSYSQQTKFNMKFENTTVRQIFQEIEDNSEFILLYSEKSVDVERKVTVNVSNQSVDRILDQVFDGTNNFYEIHDRQIAVMEKGSDKNPTFMGKITEAFQQKAVSGKVTDSTGAPLPGVTVVVKGTTNGTITDFDGKYTLPNVPGNATLVFSFVGMKTQEIVVSGKTTINVELTEDAIGIEEVVAVGYGTMKKSDITGAVSSVSEETLASRPVTTFEDALKGRSSGVQIRQTGGNLEGSFSIAIRGIGSATGSNDPLIVVDGVPLFSANLSTINPKDIAAIDVLKDASATAIFGARAANGVVMITTKKGEKGKTSLTLDADFGLEEISKRYDLLSTEQQRQLFVEAFKNSNRSTAVYDDPSNPVWQIDTDWQKLGTRTALRQSYNLGFSGGTEKTDFSGSASYLNREGIMRNSDLQMWSLRVNVNSEINKNLKLSTNITGSHQKQNVLINDLWGPDGGYRGLLFQHSYTEPYDEDGNLTAINTTAAPYFGANENPLINIMLPTREKNVSRILGNTKLDVSLLDGLTLSGNLGSDIVFGDAYTYLPVYSIGMYNRPEGSVTVAPSQQLNWVGDLTVNYEKKINKHQVKFLGGLSVQQFVSRYINTTGRGTIDNSLNQLSNQTSFNASGTDVTAGILSSFMRLNYDYSNKYLLTATVRRDGSSKFGQNNRYGIFPSGSFAWRISEEPFLKSSEWIDNLKLRVSYGHTGNQNIGDFAFISLAGEAKYVYGNSVVVGNAPINIGNPNLKWEANEQFDAGFDISIADGRIYASADYYNKQSKDLLISTPIPLTAGVSIDPIVNIGSIKNEGFEFSLTTRNIVGRFNWTTNMNLSLNKNKVVDIGTNSLGDPLEIPGENIPLSNQPANLTAAGHEAAAFYMYRYIGNWQLGEEAEAKAWSNAVPGDPRYADLNGNGKLDLGDKDFVGNPHPKFFGGIDNSFSYKQFSLSVFVDFAGGYQLYNTARNLFARSVPFVQNLAEVADFWTPENPSNTVPRPSQGGNTTTLASLVSTRFLEDADYVRIKNINLTYVLPSSLLGDKFVQSARVSVIGSNLLTLTKYSGLDPETSSRSSLLSAGIDYTPYPSTRTVSVAVQLTF